MCVWGVVKPCYRGWGHNKFVGSFNTRACSFRSLKGGGGREMFSPFKKGGGHLSGGGGGGRKKFQTSDFPIL